MSSTNASGGDSSPPNKPSRSGPSWQPPPEQDEGDAYYDLSDHSGGTRSRATGNPFAPPLPDGSPPGGAPVGKAPTSFAPTLHFDAKPVSDTGDKIRLAIGLIVIAAALFALIFALNSARPPLVEAPAAFVLFTSPDNSFQCQSPLGWKTQSSGAPGGNLASAQFEKGTAKIAIASTVAAAMTVDALHASGQKAASQGFLRYRELPAVPFPSDLGEGRISEWTAAGNLMTGKLRGYRITILGQQRAFTVFCSCPDRNWKVLSPAFFQVATSIAPVTSQSQ